MHLNVLICSPSLVNLLHLFLFYRSKELSARVEKVSAFGIHSPTFQVTLSFIGLDCTFSQLKRSAIKLTVRMDYPQSYLSECTINFNLNSGQSILHTYLNINAPMTFYSFVVSKLLQVK